MFLTYSQNFVQMRQMEITYDEENKQFHVSPLPEDYSKKKKGKKEMSFTEPLGLVPLVEPDSEQTAAYYLAAAGGEWVPNSDAVSIVFVIL